MSKRKPEIIKIGDKEFKVSPKKHTTKKEREEALIKEATTQAGAIYHVWKEEMRLTPCKPANLPGRVLAFRDMIQKKVKNKYVKKILIDLAEQAYQKAVAVAHSHTISMPAPALDAPAAERLAEKKHEKWCDKNYGMPCNCKAIVT